MKLKERLENSAVLIYAGLAVVAFVSGFAVHETILQKTGQQPLIVFGCDTCSYSSDNSIFIDDLPPELHDRSGEAPGTQAKKFVNELTIKVSELPKKLNSMGHSEILVEIENLVKLRENLPTPALLLYLEKIIPTYRENSINFLFDRTDRRRFHSAILQQIFYDLDILATQPNNNVFCTGSILFVYSNNNSDLSDLVRNSPGHRSLAIDGVESMFSKFAFAFFTQKTIDQLNKESEKETSLQIACRVESSKADRDYNACQCKQV